MHLKFAELLLLAEGGECVFLKFWKAKSSYFNIIDVKYYIKSKALIASLSWVPTCKYGISQWFCCVSPVFFFSLRMPLVSERDTKDCRSFTQPVKPVNPLSSPFSIKDTTMDDLAAVSSKLKEEQQPKMSAHCGENDVRDLFTLGPETGSTVK